MIDFHCHLDLYPDPSDMAQQCVSRGMYVLSVTTTPSAWSGSCARLQDEKQVRVALGLHPQLAKERKGELELFDRLLPTARYIGEIGLDGSPEYQAFWLDQLTVFNHILAACQSAGGRILSIHSRRAVPAVLDQLAAHQGAGVPVLHWYSGGVRDLQRAIDAGCWFSVGPPMTTSKKGMELLSLMPQDRVLTESDGPFSAVDGRNSFPWDVSRAEKQLGELWRTDAESVRESVRQNLSRLLKSFIGKEASNKPGTQR